MRLPHQNAGHQPVMEKQHADHCHLISRNIATSAVTMDHGILFFPSVSNMATDDVELQYAAGVLWGKEKLEDKEIITVWKDAETGEYIIFHLDEKGTTLRTTKAKVLPKEFLDVHQQPLSSHVQHEVIVLISSLSGTGLAPAFFDDVLEPLLDNFKIKYNIIRTTSTRTVKEFAATLGQSKQTVVALTGDGGTVDILNGISENALYNHFLIASISADFTSIKPNLVLIPLGTANALFHSTFRFSLPPYVRALRTLLHGTPKPLPNFQATFFRATSYGNPVDKLYGAVVASYGFHANLVARSDTPEYRKHGSARFAMVAKDLLTNRPVFKARVNGMESGQYVLATLVSNLENNFTVAPKSKPLDGQLWLIFLKNVMDAMKGYDSHEGSIKAEKTEKVKIEMVGEGICCVDGLIIEIEDGGWMEVQVVESKVNLVA